MGENKKKKEPTLTTRQWDLYHFLQRNDGGVFGCAVLSAMMAHDYPNDKKYTVKTGGVDNWHNPCPTLSTDVEAINNSPLVDRLIIVEDNTYRLATSEAEAQTMIDECERKIIFYSNRKAIYKMKMARDGQGKTVNNADRPMNDKCEQFHNTYGH